MTLGKRIEEVIEAIRAKRELPYQDVAKSIDQSVQYLKRIRKDRVVPSVVMLKAFCYDYGVNYEWLSTGNGPMFAHESEVQSLPSVIQTYVKERNPNAGLSDDDLAGLYAMVEMLVAILALGKESTKRAIRNNVEEFHRLMLQDRGIINLGPSETDRASPSTPDKPQKTILGGTGGK